MKRVNLEVGQNNEPTIKFRVRRKSISGVTPFDLTDKGIVMVIKASTTTSDAQAKANVSTTEGGISVPNPTNGEILIHVPLAATKDAGKFFYHLDLVTAGKATTELYGGFIVRNL